MLQSEWQKIVVAIGDSVKECRVLLGWSQAKLAEKAVTSQGTVSRIESGNHGDAPLHSIVVTFRALGTALHNMGLTVSPATQHLLDFAREIDPSYTVVASIDRELKELLDLYNSLAPKEQKDFVMLATSVARFRYAG